MNASKIQRLPDKVIKKIAAAEVAQRPATVLKELLENAIDAGSSSIKVLIEEGGKQLIQVIDNGEGMSSEDALHCFERYATSKITSLKDLYAIQTLGFRGEALASIAEVAQVELTTKSVQEEIGSQVTIHGGKLKAHKEVSSPQGTQITVKNLFFNIPARRNFLKSTQTETKYIIETFQKAALSYPSIAFAYWQNDQQLYNLPATKPIQRIVHLFGDSYHTNLIPCKEETETIALHGYIAAPTHHKKTRGGQFLFVNGRYIKSPFIQHAIKKAFEGLIMPDTFPFYILHLSIPPQHLDLHVHPMKSEVKFDNESLIYSLVSSAIKKALSLHHVIPSIDFDMNVNQDPFLVPTPPPFSTPTPQEASYTPFTQPPLPPSVEESNFLLRVESGANDSASLPLQTASKQKAPTSQTERFLSLPPNYILASIKSGLLVIDIKAAYERIFYERYSKYLASPHPSTAQKILFPVKTTLSYADFTLLEGCQDLIERLGFRLKMSAPDTITFTARPSEVSDSHLQELLEELLEQYKSSEYSLHGGETDPLGEGKRWVRPLAKRMAAHKKKERLTPGGMQALVDQLFACDHTHYTPEGKRTWYKVDMEAFTHFLQGS